MKIIGLTQGQYAIIDDCDFDLIKQITWCASYDKSSHSYYAFGWLNKKRVTMHRLIYGAVDFEIKIDHKDNNTLNNMRRNLRRSTNSENMTNRRKSKNRVIGVYPRGNKYMAKCTKDGISKSMLLPNKIDAITQREKWVKEMHGDFASSRLCQG